MPRKLLGLHHNDAAALLSGNQILSFRDNSASCRESGQLLLCCNIASIVIFFVAVSPSWQGKYAMYPTQVCNKPTHNGCYLNKYAIFGTFCC